MTRVTQGMVPGMAWLSGTGPEGTVCMQCEHARPKSCDHTHEAICDESRPVNGRRVAFRALSPSCRKFSFRLERPAAPATPRQSPRR